MNKYAPKSLADIVIGDEVDYFILQSIANGKFDFPCGGKNGFLFHGPVGTGKTTLAKLMPDEIERLYGYPSTDANFFPPDEDGRLNGKELNHIKTNSELVVVRGKFHHFIIDECDNLSRGHQKQLRNIMNVNNCIFYLTTNELNQVDLGIRSRCHEIDCNAAPPKLWIPLYTRVLQDNGASVPSSSVMLSSIEKCNGSVREIIANAQKLAAFLVANGNTWQATSAPVTPIVHAVMNGTQLGAAMPQVP